MRKLLAFVLLAVVVSCSGETDKPKKKVEAQPEEHV